MVMAGMLRGSGVFCFCKDNRQLTGFPPAADVVYKGCLLGSVHDIDATILGSAILARRGAGRALFAVADHRAPAAGTTVGVQQIGRALERARVCRDVSITVVHGWKTKKK